MLFSLIRIPSNIRNGKEIIYFNATESLHPFIQIDDTISSYINKVKKILYDCKAWNRLLRKFTQGNNKFVELIKSHPASIIFIELESLWKYFVGYMKECVFWSKHKCVNVILYFLEFDCTSLDNFVFTFSLLN